jgi:hypothetical protein
MEVAATVSTVELMGSELENTSHKESKESKSYSVKYILSRETVPVRWRTDPDTKLFKRPKPPI